MVSLSRIARVAFALLPLLALPASRAQTPAKQASAKLKWGPAPAVFRPGAKMAVVSGDPTKAGNFTIQLAMPANYRIAPHWHPTDEHVTVKSGTFLVGMGDTLNKATMKTMKAMKAGESVDLKATTHHYAATRGRTVVEVAGPGPFVLNYVNPADDPQTRMKPKAKTTMKAKS